jgi:hypothetical protein
MDVGLVDAGKSPHADRVIAAANAPAAANHRF